MLAEKSCRNKKQKLNVKAVHDTPLKITVENRLRSFQFKLIHNIIPTTFSLFKMNIKHHHNASIAFSITKLLFTCPVSALMLIFSKLVLNKRNTKRSDNINPNSNYILCGYKPENANYNAVNHLTLKVTSCIIGKHN